MIHLNGKEIYLVNISNKMW